MASEGVLGWIERIDKVHEPGYMNWITTAWATMLIKRGVVPAEETARMIADRRHKLAAARSRHLKRTEKRENARNTIVSDLCELCAQ